jgi:hypothetical protein
MEHFRLPNKTYRMLLQMDEQGKRSWATEIKHLLQNYGFGIVWENQGVENINTFLLEFSNRVKVQGRSDWYTDTCCLEKSYYYRQFKLGFGREYYLNCPFNLKIRRAYARLRCSNHPLAIETGRHFGIDRDLRICNKCNAEVEDEFHFLLKCPEWNQLRIKYLPQSLHDYTLNTQIDFLQIMTSFDDQDIKAVALFAYQAFKIMEQI